jgi:SAM-dependent methyltransferase
MFCNKLDYIEKRSKQIGATSDELMILMTRAMAEMDRSVELFERNSHLDETALQQARAQVRNATQKYFSQSFFNHGRTWPQGYPGDHKMIEFLYRNAPVSSGIGYYLDRYFLSTTLTVAVRERKELLRELLKKEMTSRTQPRVLDIACGSCREVIELAPEIIQSKAAVTCLDFDGAALAFAADRLSFAGIGPEQISYRKYNALRMVNHERNLKEFGMQDVIYSVGFFDYLDDDVLIRLLSALYTLLLPGGSLIISLKDCHQYRTFDTSWLLDWDAFYPRTEDDMWQLIEKAGIPRAGIVSSRERSGVIVFFTALK